VVNIKVIGSVLVDVDLQVCNLIFDLTGQKQVIMRHNLQLLALFVLVFIVGDHKVRILLVRLVVGQILDIAEHGGSLAIVIDLVIVVSVEIELLENIIIPAICN
jgi:hypothetical protein